MSKPMVCEFNVGTQEEIYREMTDEEYTQYLIDKEADEASIAKATAKKAEEDAAKAAVEAKLADLGLDLETIKLIAKLG